MFSLLLIMISILIGIFFVYISIRYYHKICNPILLEIVMVIAAMIAALLSKELSDSDLSYGMIWITIGLAIYNFSFLCAQAITGSRRKGKKNAYEYNLDTVNKLATLCLLLALLNLVMNSYEVLKLVNNDFKSIFTNSTYVRFLYLSRHTSKIKSIFFAFISFNYYTTLCILPTAVIHKCPHAKSKMVIVILASLISSIITMSKEAFVIVGIIILSAYLLTLSNIRQEVKFIKKNVKWFFLLIALLLIVISFQRGYVGTRYANYVESVIGTIERYLGIPINSFCMLIIRKAPRLSYGAQCFRPLVNILSYLGVVNRISIIQAAVDIRFGNVYTVFGNMFNDFGYGGIIMLSVLIGLFLGGIYKKETNNRYSSIIINSIVNVTMVFLYYDFILSQTVYLVTMIYAIVFERIIWKWLYKESVHE